ncbi:S66 peptidase family protein [Acinetobacter larvae]|uniref:LD-carboxypeptidase n=1 Tax=Acinetobacter larvae TaxID=1789224 RepID=A0A1B2M1W9_9GAMM|nr:LD-carboxypeptidase [Acinetobacter larvae]AOA59190.1 LD-carboxypeptidase [Acinetobacter larvae]
MHFYITAPSSCVEPEDILLAQQQLEQRGHQVSLSKHIFAQHRYLAGRIEQRLQDLYTGWQDATVDAIWCGRGGTGAAQLLPALSQSHLDWSTLPPLIGYSDNTALLHFLAQRGAAALHGPVFQEIASKNLPEQALLSQDAERVLDCIADAQKIQIFQLEAFNHMAHLHALQDTAVQVLGGNLTVLCTLQGTAHALTLTRPSVLLLEDVGEAYYSLERSLTQLLQSIDTQHLKAVVMGDFYNCPQKNVPHALPQIFAEHLNALGVALYLCRDFGHGAHNQAFWLGKTARFAPSKLLIGGTD